MKNNGEVIYAFIDSQNLNLSIKNDISRNGNSIYKGWQLDFRKFFIYLKTKHQVDKAFLFIGRKPGNEPLYAFLEGVGFHVIYKPCVEYNDGGSTKNKGNVDAELVLHTVIEFPNYHKAMIVSGDGDYYCLIEYLEKTEKLYRVVIPNKQSFSKLLRPFLQYAFYVTDLKQQLEKTT
jgi:uncharacterized LabA/DUF88 family protein